MDTAWAGIAKSTEQKNLEDVALLAFRDRFALPPSDEGVRELRFHKPAADKPEMKYLHERRLALAGAILARAAEATEKYGVDSRWANPWDR